MSLNAFKPIANPGALEIRLGGGIASLMRTDVGPRVAFIAAASSIKVDAKPGTVGGAVDSVVASTKSIDTYEMPSFQVAPVTQTGATLSWI